MDLGIEKSSIPDDGDRAIPDFRRDAMMDGRFRSLDGRSMFLTKHDKYV